MQGRGTWSEQLNTALRAEEIPAARNWIKVPYFSELAHGMGTWVLFVWWQIASPRSPRKGQLMLNHVCEVQNRELGKNESEYEYSKYFTRSTRLKHHLILALATSPFRNSSAISIFLRSHFITWLETFPNITISLYHSSRGFSCFSCFSSPFHSPACVLWTLQPSS